MNYRAFTTLVEICHRGWVSTATGIPVSSRNGVDLLDHEVGIELKGRLRTYSEHIAVHNYQVNQFPREHPDRELYWGFLFYELSKPVERIWLYERDLNKFITDREVWFLPWNWIRQFRVHRPETGPYRYVSKKRFPPEKKFERVDCSGGRLYLPRDSLLEQKIIPPF